MSTAEVRGSCSKKGEVKILEVEVEGMVGGDADVCRGGDDDSDVCWSGGIESVVLVVRKLQEDVRG